MRIIQVKSQSVLFEQARTKLEKMYFANTEEAIRTLQAAFPHHLVFSLGNKIEVVNKDATVKVACFQEQP